MTARRFRLDNGRLTCEGRPFFAIGANYHPSRAGCRYWHEWDPDRIDDDLRAMAAAGLNAVRVFLFWADFEPQEGTYDRRMFERLTWLVSQARRRGIGCVPSLLTLWMNGQVFDLPWRSGRSLWADEAMVERAAGFAEAVAGAVAGSGNVIAYDLGDELPQAPALGSAETDVAGAGRWRARLAAAIRDADPGAMVMQANDLSTALSGGPFSLRHRAPLDLSAAHAFATWAPFEIESHGSEKATHLAPFLVRLAAAFGPPFVDELGCYGASEEVTAGYLRTVLPAAAANGALGVFVWCWQDVASTAPPYALRPGERLVGLRHADGRPKAALRALGDFAAGAPAWAASRPVPAPVAVYVPEVFGEALHSYLDAGADWSGLFYAYVLSKRAHLPVELTNEPHEGHRLVICPSVPHVTQADLDRLRSHCHRGGVVYYSPGTYHNGFGGRDLFGVELVDFTRDTRGRERLEWDGRRYDLAAGAASDPAPVIRPAGCRVLGTFADGSVALTAHAVGAGTALYLNAPYEAGLNRPYALDGRCPEALYRRLAHLAGVEPLIACGHPELEVQPVLRNEEVHVVLVNHGSEPVACQFPHPAAPGHAVTVGPMSGAVTTPPTAVPASGLPRVAGASGRPTALLARAAATVTTLAAGALIAGGC